MATGNESVYEDLKTILYNNDAVSGEAAGLAMGLVMLGSASDKMDEMLAYAHETQHEKIIRGLALGVGLVAFFVYLWLIYAMIRLTFCTYWMYMLRHSVSI